MPSDSERLISLFYRHIDPHVRAAVASATPWDASVKVSLKLNRNVPTIGVPRYHIVVIFRKEKTHEAHFPLYRHKPRRTGPAQCGAFHHRERVRRAFGA